MPIIIKFKKLHIQKYSISKSSHYKKLFFTQVNPVNNSINFKNDNLKSLTLTLTLTSTQSHLQAYIQQIYTKILKGDVNEGSNSQVSTCY